MNERALILLIDDDQDDSFLLSRALRKAGIINEIRLANSVCDVFSVLDSRRDSQERIFVIINLSMFLSTGPLLLRWLREQDGMQDIPIVAIGNSDREADIQQAYDLGANVYFAKRLDANDLASLIRELQFVDLRPRSNKA